MPPPKGLQAFSAALERLRPLGSPPQRHVYDQWVPVRMEPGHVVLEPRGQCRSLPLEGRILQGFLRQLLSDDWRLDTVAGLPRPDAEAVLAGALLTSYGDLGYQAAADGVVAPRAVLRSIAALRMGLRVVRFLPEESAGELETFICAERPDAEELLQQLLTRTHRVEAVRRVAQLVLLEAANREGLEFAPANPEATHFALVKAPATPLQFIWSALLIGGRATLPERDVPGIYACDYQRCGEIFVRSSRRVRGERRFCSKLCGQKYWATRTTQKSRAEDRRKKGSSNDAR